MARLKWSEPAVEDLEAIVEYVGLDDPKAAKRLAIRIRDAVKQLREHPFSGSVVPELPDLEFRQIVLPFCRVFYEVTGASVIILHVRRTERLFRPSMLEGDDE